MYDVAASFAGIHAPRKNTRGSRDQLSDMCDTTHYDLLVSTPVQLAHFDTFVLQYKTTAFELLLVKFYDAYSFNFPSTARFRYVKLLLER